MTKILKCTCLNAQQDAIHGVGLRVHNLTKQQKSKDAPAAYRCTVCLEVRESNSRG